MPLVSIIMPSLNVVSYIEECLQSAINQTLKDIEIVCVNDGSTDKSLNILKKYAKKDNRIVIIDKENGGLSSSRNRGLEKATGEYVLFLDSDDYLSLTALLFRYRSSSTPTHLL